MIVYNLFLIIVLANYVKLSFAEEAPSKLISDDKSGAHYAKLLKAIIKVNEERVEAIRKVSSLQDYLLTKNADDYDVYDVKIARKSSGDSGEAEPEPQKRSTINVDCPVNKDTEETAAPYTYDDKLNETITGAASRSRSCCCPKSLKKCIKSCDRTSASVCRDLNCTEEARDLLYYNCGKYCEIYFDDGC